MKSKVRKQINFALPKKDETFVSDLETICQNEGLSAAAAIRASVRHYARALKVAQVVQTAQAFPQANPAAG